MKKIIKIFMFISLAFILFGCTDAANGSDDPKNEKPIVADDGTIIISNKVDDAILGYNEWGTGFYSYYQTDSFDITDLFKDNLPKAGDSVKFYWKGKSNKDVKNLYFQVVDIEWLEKYGSGKCNWTHLLTENERSKPLKTNIKAGEEFEISGSVILNKGAVHTINIVICCGAEDADGPVHLYSTEKENTEDYDNYSYYVPYSEKLKVISKGKMEFNKTNKTITFKTLPEIQLSDGTVVDGNDDEGKKTLLEQGAFVLWVRSNTGDFLKLIGTDDGSIPGNWGGIDNDFNEYDISSLGNYPFNVDCMYFELRDSAGLEEDDTKHYCPVLAFDVLKINE